MGAHLEAPIQVVPLDMEHEPTTDDLYEIMCRGSHVPLDDVKRYPHGHVFEDLLDCRVGPSDHDSQDRLDVGNTAMLRELRDIRDRAATAEVDNDRPFLLVPRRENRVINSTGRTLPGLMNGRSYNPAFMHPDDLASLGVVAGDLVEIRSAYDTITGVADADADLRRGVVSMSHNFGGNPDDDEDPRRRRGEHQPPAADRRGVRQVHRYSPYGRPAGGGRSLWRRPRLSADANASPQTSNHSRGSVSEVPYWTGHNEQLLAPTIGPCRRTRRLTRSMQMHPHPRGRGGPADYRSAGWTLHKCTVAREAECRHPTELPATASVRAAKGGFAGGWIDGDRARGFRERLAAARAVRAGRWNGCG